MSYCCIIQKDTDVPIKLSLTEHKESSIFENVFGRDLTIISFQKSIDYWIAPTLLHWTKFDFQSQNKRPTQKILGDYSNIYPTRCNVTQFILSGNYSTCFGWYHHPSSGTQTTVSTASGIGHTVTATCRYRGRVKTEVSLPWVVC